MILHQCPECDKSFKDAEELYYHINDFHRQLPIAIEKKCPHCEGDKVSSFGIGKEGGISFKTGEIQGKEYAIYFCEKCKHLFKIKN